MFPVANYIILFIILIILGFFYRRFEDKRIREENKENYDMIQHYLLDSSTLESAKKPIMWIYIPYEYNARNWLSFGSRSSYELNQPYLYLTVKTIIQQCNDSFHICIIDDQSFKKLLPDWSIDLGKLSAPISTNIRDLALVKLLHKYGGIQVPVSFLCMKDLITMYEPGVENNKVFMCETVDRNITSTTYKFYPDIRFMGCEKENHMIGELINFMERTVSTDFTAQSEFLGDFNRWCEARIRQGKINMVDGKLIGVKTTSNKPIVIEELLGSSYISIDPQTYGILIPSEEILKRTNYEWFARLSAEQVLESNTILGKYILLSNAPDSKGGVIEPLKPRANWISFWKTPLNAPVWGQRPLNLGDDLVPRLNHPIN